ncbi:MAG: hypothetical protein U0798_19140 [Gemmataceae bacterium]
MIQIPALRFGKPYTSLEKATLIHHVTGDPVAEVSQVTGSQIARDVSSVDRGRKDLAAIPVRDLLADVLKSGPSLRQRQTSLRQCGTQLRRVRPQSVRHDRQPDGVLPSQCHESALRSRKYRRSAGWADSRRQPRNV